MPVISHVMVRKRVIFLLCMVVMVVSLLCLRLIYLQGFRNQWLTENATEQRVREIPIEAPRGTIYDRNGKKLAVSSQTESVYAIPAEIENKSQTAASLAAVFNLPEEKILSKLERRQAFLWLVRKITTEQGKAVRALNLKGIGLTQENERRYPYHQLAAHILGFTGMDSQGLDGIELVMNDVLTGKKGGVVVEYDAAGREIPYVHHSYNQPVAGSDIYLTVDIVIQEIVERELEQLMKDTKAQGASIIAMRPNTGEVLALANRPTYDPNDFMTAGTKAWRNRAVADVYEPGSTFKIFTLSAAINEQLVSDNERFYDPGYIDVQGQRIRCWKHGGHGSQSLVEIVQNSCNPGFITLGLRLGRDNMADYVQRFSFGQRTGIDLPGETGGIVRKADKMTPLTVATMAMGQSIAVTAIQMTAGVSAAVNGGNYIRPQLLSRIYAANGECEFEYSPQPLSRSISEGASGKVRALLEGVVKNGSGRGAAIEGYSVGGKTGTAQKAGIGGYVPGKYIASFAGFMPVENPEIVLYIMIDEPEGLYYGGQIAAPVFARIMQDVGHYLQIAQKIG